MFFSLSKKTFSGWKYPKKCIFNFEKGSTAHLVIRTCHEHRRTNGTRPEKDLNGAVRRRVITEIEAQLRSEAVLGRRLVCSAPHFQASPWAHAVQRYRVVCIWVGCSVSVRREPSAAGWNKVEMERAVVARRTMHCSSDQWSFFQN